ncbi:MAG: DUF1559 domain-containing protein [Planctomycetaceae bacterium]|nr:DUF1559 domain-containing protein [Planctomycetaceae bacterium]
MTGSSDFRSSHVVSLVSVLIFSLALGVSGCRKEESTDAAPDGAKKNEAAATKEPGTSPQQQAAPRKTVPLPSEAELAKLGPVIEENRRLLRYLPNEISFFVTLNPQRFLKSEVGSQLIDVIDPLLSGISGGQMMFPFSLADISRMVVCQRPEKRAPQPDPAAGGMPVISSEDEIPLLFMLYEFAAPKEDIDILSGLNQRGVTPDVLASLRPEMSGKIKIYNLMTVIPNAKDRPEVMCIIIFDAQTAAFLVGGKTDILSLYDETPASGALAQRLLHTDLNKDIYAVISDEGIIAETSILQQLYFIPFSMGLRPGPQNEQEAQKLVKDSEQLTEMVKGGSVFIDLSAADGEKLLSASLFAQPGKAKDLQTILEDQLTAFKVMVGMMVQQQSQVQSDGTSWTSQQFAFLDSLVQSVELSGDADVPGISLAKPQGFNQQLLTQNAALFNAVRESKKSQQALEALQPMSRALELYVKEKGQYPAWAISSQDGTPLLSWRVAMLPSLGYKELYDKFHLNEPWDSEANKPLIAEMPQVFASPITQTPPGMTLYRMFGGAETFQAEHPQGIAKADLEPLTQPGELFFFVTVKPDQAVEWTKPEVLPYTPESVSAAVPPVFIFMMYSGQTGSMNFTQIPKPFLDYYVSGKLNPEVRAAQAEQERRMQEMMRQYQQQREQQPTVPNAVPEMPLEMIPAPAGN